MDEWLKGNVEWIIGSIIMVVVWLVRLESKVMQHDKVLEPQRINDFNRNMGALTQRVESMDSAVKDLQAVVHDLRAELRTERDYNNYHRNHGES